jgi:hypothetical protein
MALTKANSDVIDIANVSTSLGVDTTAAGIKVYVDNADAAKAPLASPTFTGVVSVPDQLAGDNSNKAANTRYVGTAVTNAVSGLAATASTYGPSSRASGPRVYVSTTAPSGGVDGDIWIQYV